MTQVEKYLALTVIFVLATVKVCNELKMTSAYDRQAVALERIADAEERAHPAPPKCTDDHSVDYCLRAAVRERIADDAAQKNCGTLVVPRLAVGEIGPIGLRLDDGTVLDLPANVRGGQRLCFAEVGR